MSLQGMMLGQSGIWGNLFHTGCCPFHRLSFK